MKQKNLILGIIFLTGIAVADEIDAEIVKNIDFYSDMEMVEDMDQYQNQALNEDQPQVSPAPAEKSRE